MKLLLAASSSLSVIDDSRYIEVLVDELPARGIEIAVCDFADVRSLPWGFRHFIYFRRLYRQLKGCEVVYATGSLDGNYLAYFAARLTGKKFSLKVVRDYAWERANSKRGVIIRPADFLNLGSTGFYIWLLKKVQTYIARQALGVIVASNYLKNIVSRWGVSPEIITVIVDPLVWSGLNQVNLAPDKTGPVLVSVGPLVPWRHLDTLIESVFELLIQYPDIKLYIYGSGPERDYLWTHIEKHNLKDHIFLKDQSEKEAIYRQIQYADILVATGVELNLSPAVLLAMSIGTPVVVSADSADAEIVKNGSNGLSVPPGDSPALQGAIKMIVANQAVGQKLVFEAKQTIGNFDTKQSLDDLAEFFSSL